MSMRLLSHSNTHVHMAEEAVDNDRLAGTSQAATEVVHVEERHHFVCRCELQHFGLQGPFDDHTSERQDRHRAWLEVEVTGDPYVLLALDWCNARARRLRRLHSLSGVC
jgi:hypothetical protein